ncbi:MAG TPA: GNAT family protein [Actinomycetes bacterium]
MATRPSAVTLQGRHVRLEPLEPDHVTGLAAATAGDEEVWRWLPSFPADEAEMRAVVAAALAERDSGLRFPFAVLEAGSGRVVGSSSYLDIDPVDERIEIGWTWLSRSVWRSAVNTEAKLLLLGHAFDDLGCERVALKTHHQNERSQAAIARLGAVREGMLRHHVRHRDGTWRDSVYYSILSAEWPEARDRLRARLTGG